MWSFLSQTTTAKQLSSFLIIILLSFSRDLIAFHSSKVRLEYLKEVFISSNNSFSTLRKKTSTLGWAASGFQDDLDQTAGMVLKVSEGSFLKCHFVPICRKNSSKSFLNSGSFTSFWIGAKSNSFSKTLVSSSESTL